MRLTCRAPFPVAHTAFTLYAPPLICGVVNVVFSLGARRYVFLVHASSDATATDAAFMGWLSYADLMVLSGVTDDACPGVRQADIDTLFKAANFEAKDKTERAARHVRAFPHSNLLLLHTTTLSRKPR